MIQNEAINILYSYREDGNWEANVTGVQCLINFYNNINLFCPILSTVIELFSADRAYQFLIIC